jgi:hypothetical protein
MAMKSSSKRTKKKPVGEKCDQCQKEQQEKENNNVPHNDDHHCCDHDCHCHNRHHHKLLQPQTQPKISLTWLRSKITIAEIKQLRSQRVAKEEHNQDMR